VIGSDARHGVVDAGLDALASVLPLDLCAHLDDSPAGAQLYLRVPSLASLDATAAYRLFADLRTALDKAGVAPGDPHVVEVDGVPAVAITTAGGHTRRVTVAGRREGPLSPGEVDAVVHLARALALVEPAATAADGPLRVSVELSGVTARAVVTVGGPGNESSGMSEAGGSTEAVARAALDALSSDVAYEGVGELALGAERAVVVLVRRPDGSPALGAAVVGADLLHSVASAAIVAAGEATSG
jgi:hypothetical protein